MNQLFFATVGLAYTSAVIKPSHPLNISPSIVVTVPGTTMLESDLQFINAAVPRLVTARKSTVTTPDLSKLCPPIVFTSFMSTSVNAVH